MEAPRQRPATGCGRGGDTGGDAAAATGAPTGVGWMRFFLALSTLTRGAATGAGATLFFLGGSFF